MTSERSDGRTAARRRWFDENFGQAAFLVLSNLLRFNLQSRRLLVNAEYNAIYRPLADGSGELSKLSADQRRMLLDAVTLDLLAKVMASVEDLGKILRALGKLPKDMPSELIGATQANSLAVFGRLAAEDDQVLFGRLDLWDPARYGIEGDDALALRQYNQIFIGVMRALFSSISEFVAWHELAYNKSKHGNSILMALGSGEAGPGNGFTAPIGIFDDHTDLGRMKFLLGGERVVSQLLTMQAMVVDTARALVERRLQLAEFGGTPLPVLCEGAPQPPNETEYKPLVFATVPADLWQRLEVIWRGYMGRADYMHVVLSLISEFDRAKLQERMDYYNREWNPTKRGTP